MKDIYNNLNGIKFGRLTVLMRYGINKYGQITWLCECDCGKFKIILGYDIVNGKSISCGCYNKYRTIEAFKGDKNDRNSRSNMEKRNTRIREGW